MTPTGSFEDDGRTLLLTRTFPVAIDDVWAGLTESERLERWFGTWSGDPSSGSVTVRMNAEAEEAPPVRYDIDECDPPRVLRLRASDDYGDWVLSVILTERDGTTTLEFRQHDLPADVVASVGPGWEWYLDRLRDTVLGEQPPSLDEFDAYMTMSDAYVAMRG